METTEEERLLDQVAPALQTVDGIDFDSPVGNTLAYLEDHTRRYGIELRADPDTRIVNVIVDPNSEDHVYDDTEGYAEQLAAALFAAGFTPEFPPGTDSDGTRVDVAGHGLEVHIYVSRRI